MRTAIAFVCLALGAGGCVVEVDFDPIGTDATMEGSWTIGAQAPTEEICAASAITHVRVRFYETRGEGDEAMEIFRDHPDLVFACADGGFDTRPDGVLRSGEYRIRVLAIDNDVPLGEDNIVAMGPEVMSDTGLEAGHVVLPLVDFSP